MTTINGVSAISIGLKDNPIFEPMVIPNHEPWQPVPAGSYIATGTIDIDPETIVKLFGTWELEQPKYKVRITTRRTPRKLKKRLKKLGKYQPRRHYNFDNANITATFI